MYLCAFIILQESQSHHMRQLEKHFVQTQPQPVRLSDYVAGIFQTISSKKGMKKAIEKGLVKVNGQVAFTGRYLNGGEIIELFAAEDISDKPMIDLDLDVLYEDDHIAIVNKPAGIVVSGNKSHTLENAFPLSLTQCPLDDALPRPLPAHRLDYPTSGVLLVGKTSNIITALNKLFEHRHIKKTYTAIIQGELKDLKQSGTIDTVIKGKKAKTNYTIQQTLPSPKFGALHVIELNPHTGRRHQLRIHMAEMGTPILGDQQYGQEGKILLGKGLFLHATSIEFVHPVTEENIGISAPLPKKFKRLLGNKLNTQEEE